MTISIISNVILALLAVLSSFLSYFFHIKNELEKAVPDAINNAELAGKTGAEKLELATTNIYKLVPKYMHTFITKEFVRNIIQLAFDKIADYARKQAE